MEPNVHEAVEPIASPKKGKLRFLVVLLLAVVILGGIGVGAFAWLYESPAERTLEAVFPMAELLSDMETSGTVTLSGEVGQDFVPALKTEPITLQATIAFKGDRMSLDAAVGHGEDLIRMDAIGYEEGVEWGSESLMGDRRLKATVKDFLARLEESPLASDSGSDYALSESQMETIRTLLERWEQEDDERLDELVEDALDNVKKKTKGLFEKETKRELISLLDGEKRVKVTTISYDEADLLQLIEALLSECEENEELWKRVSELPDGVNDMFSRDELKIALWNLRDTFSEGRRKGTVKYAVCGGCLVYFEWSETIETRQLYAKEEFLTEQSMVSIKFHSDPEKNASFEAYMERKSGEQLLQKGSLIHQAMPSEGSTTEMILHVGDGMQFVSMKYTLQIDRTENDGFLLTFIGAASDIEKNIEDALFEEQIRMKAEGTYRATGKKLELGLHAFSLRQYDETLQLQGSRFTLSLSPKASAIRTHRRAEEVTSLTREGLEELDQSVHAQLMPLASKINEGLGVTLLTYQVEMLERIAVNGLWEAYAFDPVTERVFAEKKEHESGIREFIVYDAGTLKILGMIRHEAKYGTGTMMAADGGFLAVGDRSSKKMTVYHATTLETVTTVELAASPHDLVMDGSVLLYYNFDQRKLYRTDWETGATEEIDSWSAEKSMALAVSVKDHVLMAASYDGTASFYRTDTGEKLAQVEINRSDYELAYFDGAFFSCGRKRFTPAGAPAEPTLPGVDAMKYYLSNDESTWLHAYDQAKGKTVLQVYLKGGSIPIHSTEEIAPEAEILQLDGGRYLILQKAPNTDYSDRIALLEIRGYWRIVIEQE